MIVKIDKGIPMPPGRKESRGILTEYPWDKLEVGDSFLIDIKPKSANTWCSHAAVKYNKKFAYRTFNQGKESEEVRVWRIE